MRWVVPFVVVLVGCVVSLPPDDETTADLACEAARMIVEVRSLKPPSPKPVSEKCDNCNGTGKVGDGRVSVVCPVCDGTGKKPVSVLVPQ